MPPQDENRPFGDDPFQDYCPKCSAFTGGDSNCPECGAKIFDDSGLEEFEEGEDQEEEE